MERIRGRVGSAYTIIPGKPLSPREREVLFYTAIGMTAEGIGAELGIEADTATNHRHNSYVKLGVFAGAPEAIALLLTTDQEFYDRVKMAILAGAHKPISHPRGGTRGASGYREWEATND